MHAAVSSPRTLAKFLADYSSNRVLERLPLVLHALATLRRRRSARRDQPWTGCPPGVHDHEQSPESIGRQGDKQLFLRTIVGYCDGHLCWPDLDVDLATESIDHPDRFPLISQVRSSKRGGQRADAAGAHEGLCSEPAPWGARLIRQP
jgi:hypothetical protein